MFESIETTTTTTTYDPPASVRPGNHLWRVALSPSGKSVDIRADRVDLHFTNHGTVLDFWSQGVRTASFLPSAYTWYARVDTLPAPTPTATGTTTLADSEVEGEL